MKGLVLASRILQRVKSFVAPAALSEQLIEEFHSDLSIVYSCVSLLLNCFFVFRAVLNPSIRTDGGYDHFHGELSRSGITPFFHM